MKVLNLNCPTIGLVPKTLQMILIPEVNTSEMHKKSGNQQWQASAIH